MSQSTHSLDAVLFDLDGTLIDTSGDFIACINILCDQHQQPQPDPQRFIQSISNGARGMVAQAFQLSASAPQLSTLIDEFLEIYQDNIAQHSVLYPGMPELIKRLEQRALPWGIVTNKYSCFAQPLISALQLQPGCLVCPDHVKNAKPDPEPLLLASQQLQVKASRCLYAGDHRRDIEAGRSAGMLTLAAAYGYIDDSDSAGLWKADYYAATPCKVSSIIEQHFSVF